MIIWFHQKMSVLNLSRESWIYQIFRERGRTFTPPNEETIIIGANQAELDLLGYRFPDWKDTFVFFIINI